MRKGTNKTPGQLLYELMASEDRRPNVYWPEWRDRPEDEKTRWEEEATRLLALAQGKQEDQEKD